MDEFKDIAVTVLSIVVLMVLSVILVIAINVHFFDNVPIKVWINKELVYEGISAGVDVKSSGDNTKVKIYKGFLYMFPDKYFVAKDVVIKGEK